MAKQNKLDIAEKKLELVADVTAVYDPLLDIQDLITDGQGINSAAIVEKIDQAIQALEEMKENVQK